MTSRIDEQIVASDTVICRQISRIGEYSRAQVSQEVLESLRHFIEHILLKIYANGIDIEDTHNNIQAAIKYAKSVHDLKHISRFHRLLQVSVSHRVLQEQNAERLMHKYYESLLHIRKFLQDRYSLDVLGNLEEFQIEVDEDLFDYHIQVSAKVDSYHTPMRSDYRYDRFYVVQIKPFFVNKKIYYEVAFVPANDNSSKTDKIIGFTDLEISSFYAVKLAVANDNVEVLGKCMPIRIITDWEVSIRPCELKNYSKIMDNIDRNFSKIEQGKINQYLTNTGFSFSEIISMSDSDFALLYDQLTNKSDSVHFMDVLLKSRQLIIDQSAGGNILRYLLHRMTNRVLKDQYHYTKSQMYGIRGCHKLSGLYLDYKCIPFDTMPLCSCLVSHIPSLSDLFECFEPTGREHEILAAIVKINTEKLGVLFTPLEISTEGGISLGDFNDIPSLVEKYNSNLYQTEQQQARKMMIKFKHLFFEGYLNETLSIIGRIQELASVGIANYSNMVTYWMNTTDQVNSEEKKQALLKLFAKSRVALVYGSAGTGKSYLINHVSNLFSDKSRLYLTQTNPAINNLRRKVTASSGSTFMTIAKIISRYYSGQTDFDILIIDECSTVNNHDLNLILDKIKFELLILVGDTYQIESIEFGNWFYVLRYFLNDDAVVELVNTYRSQSDSLLRLWNDVRNMEEDIFELLQTFSYSTNLDTSIFSQSSDNEIILCLNYGGLYGINNINHFLQENNAGKEVWRGVHRYKVGDPILFNDQADRFFTRIENQLPVIHNNMKGRIADISIQNEGKTDEYMLFDIEVDRPLIELDAKNMEFTIIGSSFNGNSIIRFKVNKNKSTDEDDDNFSNTIVPFQIAYAVSIHKAQGLEYQSVKIVITDEIDELLTHNIFYTAITRATRSLRIYWTESVERSVLAQIKPKDISKDISLLKHMIASMHGSTR